MQINPIIIGSTGMVGKGLLLECLESQHVKSILVINRNPIGIKHAKLKEIIHKDFSDFSPLINELAGYDTCYFCMGVSAAGPSESEYKKITYDLTIHIANTLLKVSRDITFCYVSGAGTDSSEKGRMMWARVKGKTENDLLTMPFKAAYMFRPGYIHPMKGIKSRTRVYNIFYFFLKPIYFLLKPFKGIVTNTESLGKAMIHAVVYGCDKKVIESGDINTLAERE